MYPFSQPATGLSHRLNWATLALSSIGAIAIASPASAFSLGGASLSWALECFNDSTTQQLGSDLNRGTWYYNQDATGDDSGGSHYEIFGSAFMETKNDLYFVINAYDMALHAGGVEIKEWVSSTALPENLFTLSTSDRQKAGWRIKTGTAIWESVSDELVPTALRSLSSSQLSSYGWKTTWLNQANTPSPEQLAGKTLTQLQAEGWKLGSNNWQTINRRDVPAWVKAVPVNQLSQYGWKATMTWENQAAGLPSELAQLSTTEKTAQGWRISNPTWKNVTPSAEELAWLNGLAKPADYGWRLQNGQWQQQQGTWQQQLPTYQQNQGTWQKLTYQKQTGEWEQYQTRYEEETAMRNIGWGDLLIDLSGLGLAQNNGSLFGVHFGRNSGGMTELGLYKDVTAKAIGGQHQGYGSIAQYDGFVKNQKSAGKLSDETRLYGDVSRSEGASYYGQPYNVIGSGEFVSSIEMLDLSELMKRGYKGDQFQGKSTIAFKISKQGFAPAPVPEPSSVLGLLGLGLIVARRRQA